MLYPIFLLIALIEMLGEIRISAGNSARLLQEGAVDVAPAILPIMAVIFVLMYTGSFLEYFLMSRDVSMWWFTIFLGVFLSAKGLKFWAVSALGRYWTMKVLIVPESKVITTGPYRWIRHPNYVAVLMEIAGTTLTGKNFITFAFVFVSFAIVLYCRIRVEEKALLKNTNYSEEMISRRRFLP